MKDRNGTQEQFISELEKPRLLISDCKTSQANYKQLEKEYLSRINFQNNIKRINLLIPQSIDVEQRTTDVLDEMLSIFNCDRTWLHYRRLIIQNLENPGNSEFTSARTSEYGRKKKYTCSGKSGTKLLTS